MSGFLCARARPPRDAFFFFDGLSSGLGIGVLLFFSISITATVTAAVSLCALYEWLGCVLLALPCGV
jgi:hypothetical protein